MKSHVFKRILCVCLAEVEYDWKNVKSKGGVSDLSGTAHDPKVVQLCMCWSLWNYSWLVPMAWMKKWKDCCDVSIVDDARFNATWIPWGDALKTAQLQKGRRLPVPALVPTEAGSCGGATTIWLGGALLHNHEGVQKFNPAWKKQVAWRSRWQYLCDEFPPNWPFWSARGAHTNIRDGNGKVYDIES